MRAAGFVRYLSAGVLLALAASAWAVQTPYNRAEFDRDIAQGKPAIVYIRASWCPTCAVQKPIVDRLSNDPELKSVTIFVADFDTEKALKQSLKVTMQSTFVVFKQGHEVARSTGQTKEQAIRETFEKAL
jgi:thioredoxin 1